MTKQNYPINDPALKNYVETLEQTAKDSHKGLPRNYNRIKTLEEKAEVLQGQLFKKLLKINSLYKIYR